MESLENYFTKPFGNRHQPKSVAPEIGFEPCSTENRQLSIAEGSKQKKHNYFCGSEDLVWGFGR